MKLKFVITFFVAVVMMSLVGCNDDDKVMESQRTAIERYLTSSHVPRLIAHEDVANSIEYNPPFYDKMGLDLYRYIATYYDEGRDSRSEVVKGAEVEIVYTAYLFKGSAPKANMAYATNDAEMIAQLAAMGLDAEYWSDEPMRIKMGSTNIITGLEKALLGCREGDVVEVYMTSKVAYDDKSVGVILRDMSVMWSVTITSVTK